MTPRQGWKRAAETVWGPLLTLAAIILLDILARSGTPVLYPFPVLLLTVVVAAYLGGLRTSLISAVLTVLYGVHFFAEPGFPMRYRPSGGYSLLAVGLIAPGIAILVSRLHATAQRGRAAELSRAEAEALDRRVSLLSQASATLASSLDYEVTLRELARLVVPTLGDWCAFHVIGERGVPLFLAGAHRDPARDLLVRALCEYGERRVPFGPPAGGDPVEVTFHRYPEKSVLLLFFAVSRVKSSPEPRALDVADVRWAGPDELDDELFPPADVAILSKVRALLSPRT